MPDQVFIWPVRVYYEDTDSGGVVYYANYLKYMERARTEYLRASGFEQTALAADHGVMFVVRRVSIEYHKPARFNDELIVTSRVTQLGRCRIVFRQAIERGEMLVSGEVDVACVSATTFKPAKIPSSLRQAMEKPT